MSAVLMMRMITIHDMVTVLTMMTKMNFSTALKVIFINNLLPPLPAP